MADFGVPAAYAALLWWFTTGVILLLDGRPQATFRRSMAIATGLLVAAGCVLRATSSDASGAGAYAGFTCAILVWGWIEMSFLMGFITGPRKHACSERCGGWRHFLHATQAVIYNELVTLLGAAAITFATWQAPNRLALWTYLVLWSMRLSAKLNLFLGVPNLGEKFLPVHLRYLRSFFRKRAMNFLFPLSICASTVGVCALALKYSTSAVAFDSTSYALLTSLLTLAVLEHWFMVLPLPSERLWKWAMRSGGDVAPGHAPLPPKIR